MTPKRGQPPKPPEEKRVEKKELRYSTKELELLEEAYQLIGMPNTFSRWLANVTLEEAEKIVREHKK